MTHTPGPWEACGKGRCTCKDVSAKDHPVAHIICGEWGDEYPNIQLSPREDGIGYVAIAFLDKIVYGEIEEEMAAANALLIATAPDLLAACKALVARIDEWMALDMPCPLCDGYVPHFDDCPYAFAAAAIAKAKGKD